MMGYQRPDFPNGTFRDASGEVIPYGRRWRGESPPEEAYRVSTHSERFAPLHAVAEALIEYLLRRYDAWSRDDPAVVADLMSGRDDIVRAVRITPAGDDAAPLTFAFTGYPGVVLHAGLLHDFHFPSCGCDACDESAAALADELEETVTAVTDGRYRETLDVGSGAQRPPGRWAPLPARLDAGSSTSGVVESDLRGGSEGGIGFRIVASDGSHRRSGWTALSRSDPPPRLAAAQVALGRLEDGWRAWPLRRV